MSGHSKWSTIKRKKGAADAKRSQMFAKLLRAVEVAAREGGPNIDGNMTLAAAVEKARDNSVPWDNIERAIKRAAGDGEGAARYEDVMYEGYGPGGVAFLVHALTDNRNRTSQEVRHAFTRGGGTMADPGSVAWQFDRRGLIVLDKATSPDEDAILEAILEVGADDLSDAGEQWEVVTEPDALGAVRTALTDAGIQIDSAELTMIPQNDVPVDGGEKAGQVLRLYEALEDLDDTQAVYANFDIPQEILAEVG
jgi:YebC/PmpR family DNA-binding regulatory protein